MQCGIAKYIFFRFLNNFKLRYTCFWLVTIDIKEIIKLVNIRPQSRKTKPQNENKTSYNVLFLKNKYETLYILHCNSKRQKI